MRYFLFLLIALVVLLSTVDAEDNGNKAAEERARQIREARLIRRRDCNKMNVQNTGIVNDIAPEPSSSSSSSSSSSGKNKHSSATSSSDESSPSSSSADGPEFSGTLTNYNVEENEGACGSMNTNEEMVAALNSAQFQADSNGSSVYCGMCATILGDKAQITVKIVDECPSCADQDLDLSPAAFAAVTSADGEAHNVKWYFTQC